ncbi:MAG: hypothetical protein H6567_06250 [Lewinellaceae bacterium]|nr:hypothetical protein [Lewinellaceae bacterium]
MDQVALRGDGSGGSNFQKDLSIKGSKFVLGKKRVNPFEIHTINRAKNRLYGNTIPDKIATHQYIKFMPNDEDDLYEIDIWDVIWKVKTFEFPLEYEIVSSGETYIDPTVSDSTYTYLYAAVPDETPLPDVPYTVIDDLYLETDDPFLLAESFWLTGNEGEINDYVFKGGLDEETVKEFTHIVVAGRVPVEKPDEDCPPGFHWELVIDDANPTKDGKPNYVWECRPNEPSPPPPSNACCTLSNNWRFPGGCVRVDFDGIMRPVQNAEVITKDTWFTSDETHTSNTGCWSIEKEYSGKVWIWVHFRNENVFAKDVGYWGSLKSVRDYVGKFTAPPYNNVSVEYGSGAGDNTTNARRYWAAAHTLNTINQYRNAAGAEGVPLPRTSLNWTNSNSDGGGAAPMLQGHPFSSWPAFLLAIRFPVLTIASINQVPDIVNQYGDFEGAAVFTGTGFHELGHASHYSKVGEGYWIGYRNHIINNWGYGSFGSFAAIGSDPGKVALGEAVGNFTGAWWGNTQAGGEGFQWEDNFIPRGLLWDLQDNIQDVVTNPVTGQSLTDNITGFTPRMFFNALAPNFDNVHLFKVRLQALHLADTPNSATDYNNFVDLYDVFQ